ncbi:hypothetical protein REPUB_Repub05bG0071400 [Reevesia pubescens]
MGNKTFSFVVVGTLVAAAVEVVEFPDLHTNVGLVVVVVEIGILEDTDDVGKGSFLVGFLATLLLLLLLLYDLNLELDFVDDDVVADDDDDSFEDPDSGPCAFPVPAFNGGHLFLLVGCWFFTLSLLPNFLLLSVLLPPH